MVKESAKKCLNCGHQVHNSKSCNGNGKSVVKLFGVNLLEKKSIKNKEVIQSNSVAIDVCNDSDGQILPRKAAIENNREKKWTKEEHQMFLTGMEKLGKGKWSEISREFVKTRTPIQVASHAQKHFRRQQASNDKRKRSSIFDMPLNQTAQDPQDSQVVPLIETAKTSLETSTSSVLTSNNTLAISPETVDPAKVSSGFPHVFLYDSSPIPLSIAYPINYHGIQQTLKDPCKWQSFLENKMMPSPSFVPYGHIPYTSGNFATRVPVSNITSPQSFTHNMFLSGLGTSSRV